MKNRLLICFLISLWSARVSAQDAPDLDSLRNLIGHAHDTVRVKALAELGVELIINNPDSALTYLNQAYTLARETDYKKGQAVALNYLGRWYTARDQYATSLEYFLKCFRVDGYSQKNEMEAMTHYDIGQLYSRICGSFPSDEINIKSIYHFRKTALLFEALPQNAFNNEKEACRAGLNTELGRAYLRFNQLVPRPYSTLDSSNYYFHEALNGAKEIKLDWFIFYIYNDLANVSSLKKNYSEAIAWQRKAIASSIDPESFPALYRSLSRIYLYKKDFDSARYFLEVSRHHDLQKKYLQPYYQMLGEIHEASGNTAAAIREFMSALKMAEQVNGRSEMQMAAKNLAMMYERARDPGKALKYLRMSYELDSINSKDVYLKMSALQSEFDVATQQAQLDLALSENKVKDLLIEKSQTRQLVITAGLMLLAIVVVIFVYQNRLIRSSKRDQEKAFREVDRMKSQFFANISHEFRTPLTLILAPLERQLAFATAKEEREELSVMHRNASRLLTLVNELLDLSSLDAGSLRLKASYHDLGDLARYVAAQFSSIASSRQIQFTVRTEGNARILIDTEKMEKVIGNLLGNAFKFTPPNGAIALSVAEHPPTKKFDAGFVELRVSDTGPGISANHVGKIFDRFYQVDDSPTRAHEGSGIGLALAKEIVELHHGKLHVESELGKGSTFIVQLRMGSNHFSSDEIIELSPPLSDISFVEEPAEEHQSAAPATSESILIIEDNPDLRTYLRKSLEQKFIVLEAAEGIAGLASAVEHVPTLIITDLMMPGMDGLGLCKRIKTDESTSHIPVIMLTARADRGDRVNGYNLGADDYIAKPFTMIELMARIDNLIASRILLREKFSRQLEVTPSAVVVESIDEQFIRRAITIVEKHMDDASFGVNTFAEEMHLSTAQLYRKLQALTNFTPNEFVRHLRLKRAFELLDKKAGNVAEVAYRVGFNNLSYFAKVYKDKFGISPSEVLRNT